MKVISQYYHAIFSALGFDCVATVNKAISPCISACDDSQLMYIPDREEVRKTVFAIHADKAPGPDGFSAGFYHSTGIFIGWDIYLDIWEFFDTWYLQRRKNETHIRLIPKFSFLRKVSDFRPIALCTTHYKIIAKILPNRLQPVSHFSLISSLRISQHSCQREL